MSVIYYAMYFVLLIVLVHIQKKKQVLIKWPPLEAHPEVLKCVRYEGVRDFHVKMAEFVMETRLCDHFG